MNISALKETIISNKAIFGLTADDEEYLSVKLHAPWRNSRTGRCLYFIYRQRDDVPFLVVKDAISLYAPSQPLSEVPFSSQFMPAHGYFFYKEQQYEWAHFVNGVSLYDLLGDSLRAKGKKARIKDFIDTIFAFPSKKDKTAPEEVTSFIQIFFKEQMNSSCIAPIPVDILAKQCLEKIFDQKGKDFFTQFAHKLFPQEKRIPILCSWSHGDLWQKDIIYTEVGYKVLDWEWHTACAPLGSDCIDLCVNICIHNEGRLFEDVWKNMATTKLACLAPVYGALPYDIHSQEWLFLLRYCFLRSLGRELAQDGMTHTVFRVYKKIEEGVLSAT